MITLLKNTEDNLDFYFNKELILKFEAVPKFETVQKEKVFKIVIKYLYLDNIINKCNFDYKTEHVWKTGNKPSTDTYNMNSNTNCSYEECYIYISKLYNYIRNNKTQFNHIQLIYNMLQSILIFLIENNEESIIKMIEDNFNLKTNSLYINMITEFNNNIRTYNERIN